MTVKVVQMNRIGKVTFSRNIRSKNIKISVKPDRSVLVSYPLFVSSGEVITFLEKNITWICEQQDKFTIRKKPISEGMQIQTKLHQVTIRTGEKNSINKTGSQITVYLKDSGFAESHTVLEKIMTRIYRFEAGVLLPKKLRELALIHGFSYNRVTIRDNKRNWGSCSHGNNISLNLQMMKLPDELIDYILLHELVHTEIKNHGPEFWRRLDVITGNRARLLSREVKKFSTFNL